MNCRFFPLVAFATACIAQVDLPPERAQLVQIRERMNQNQERIPNYTCLETITRSRRPPHSIAISRNGSPGRFLKQDIVRLEVAAVDGNEFYASPGAHNFTETDISLFITGGMIGNGLFALFAQDIFNSHIATYEFAGETTLGGHRLLRYNFQVPLLLSHYHIKCMGIAQVGYHGVIWADPKTFDAVRVEIQADDIPLGIGVVTDTVRIDYATVRIGAADVLLPQSAEMTMLIYNDWEDRNNIAFTHCREYGVSSAISFEAPSVEPSSAPAPPREIEVPPGLTLTTRLETALDSIVARPGDLVRGRVEMDVKHKGAVLIPKDTIVTGRIRNIDRYTAPSHYYLIALEFYRFEFPRGPVRFFAEVERILAPAGERVGLSMVRSKELPGVATFSVKGDTLQLASGTRIVWKTSPYGQR